MISLYKIFELELDLDDITNAASKAGKTLKKVSDGLTGDTKISEKASKVLKKASDHPIIEKYIKQRDQEIIKKQDEIIKKRDERLKKKSTDPYRRRLIRAAVLGGSVGLGTGVIASEMTNSKEKTRNKESI